MRWLESFQIRYGHSHGKCVVISLFQTIWMKRNARIFSDGVIETVDLFEKSKFSASLWESISDAIPGWYIL